MSVLKELFSEHGIPETLRSDNGPQFANHLFAEFAKEWNFDQEVVTSILFVKNWAIFLQNSLDSNSHQQGLLRSSVLCYAH